MGLTQMLRQCTGFTSTATKETVLAQHHRHLWILPKVLKTVLCSQLVKVATHWLWEINRQKLSKDIFSGLKWGKHLVLHHLEKHGKMPQGQANMIQSVLMLSRVAYTVAMRIKQPDQNQRQLLRAAPNSGVTSLEMARQVSGTRVPCATKLTVQSQRHSLLRAGEPDFHVTARTRLQPVDVHRQCLCCRVWLKFGTSALGYV